MEVVIIGKEERKGKSKATGKDFHFNKIYYTKEQRNVIGQVGAEKIVNPAMIGIEEICVGELYDLGFNDNGGVESIRLVTKSK